MKIEKGDKYIIEIGEIHTHYDDNGHEYKLARIKGFKSLVFDENGLKKLERFSDSFGDMKRLIDDTRRLLRHF